MSESKVCIVVGVGPGLGASVARRFAKGGFDVALVARRKEVLDPVESEVRAIGRRALSVPSDASDTVAVAGAYATIERELGAASVLVYNASAFAMGGIVDITPDVFEGAWKVSCLGAFLWARAALPAMIAQRSGTLLFTGATASLRGSARFAAFAVGKFGLRALAQSIAREVQPSGVHVAHVVIDGQIASDRVRSTAPGRAEASMLSPDAIAETYWHLHNQDPTAWTHELELRPSIEKF